MTIILKPFSAPTVQFPQKRKTSYPQSLSYLSIKLYRHYFYIINESLISTSYFTGIILNQFTVLIECNFILLFYLLRVSIRCYCFINLMYNPFVYWLFKRTFGSNTFKLYSAFLMMFYSSNSLFGVVEVTRFFMCCGWPLSWSNTRSVEDPLRCHLIHANSNLQCEQQRLWADAPFPLYWSSTWHSIKTYFSQHHSALLALRDIEKQIAWALLKSLKIWSP